MPVVAARSGRGYLTPRRYRERWRWERRASVRALMPSYEWFQEAWATGTLALLKMLLSVCR